MTINTYHIYFTSGVIIEYTLPKLTCKQYREIMQELCFAADCHDFQEIEHARIWQGSDLIAEFDLIPWIDDTVTIFLETGYQYQVVRRLFKEGKPAVCLF